MGEVIKKSQKSGQDYIKLVEELSKSFGVLNERAKLIEQRLRQNTEKTRVIDESFSSKIRDLKENMEQFSSRVNDVSKDVEKMREILRQIAKGMEDTAKLGDVKILEKYINMIDFTRIVTRDDVERIVSQKINESRKK